MELVELVGDDRTKMLWNEPTRSSKHKATVRKAIFCCTSQLLQASVPLTSSCSLSWGLLSVSERNGPKPLRGCKPLRVSSERVSNERCDRRKVGVGASSTQPESQKGK